jgi:hypothetical protein
MQSIFYGLIVAKEGSEKKNLENFSAVCPTAEEIDKQTSWPSPS